MPPAAADTSFDFHLCLVKWVAQTRTGGDAATAQKCYFTSRVKQRWGRIQRTCFIGEILERTGGKKPPVIFIYLYIYLFGLLEQGAICTECVV